MGGAPKSFEVPPRAKVKEFSFLSLPSSDRLCGSGPIFSRFNLGFGADHFADFTFQEITGFLWPPASAEE
jgi:hypothetical protein